MSSYNLEVERGEAIDVGRRALGSLRNAKRELDSARDWGIFDMLGGGLISTFAKHSKMDKAQNYLEQAKADLRNFSRELRDVEQSVDLNINTDEFLTFADYFFDGILADWLMQDKINNARRQVDEAIRRVEYVLSSLQRM